MLYSRDTDLRQVNDPIHWDSTFAHPAQWHGKICMRMRSGGQLAQREGTYYVGLSKAGLAEGFALFSHKETFEWSSTSKHIGVCAAAAKRGAILVLTLRFYSLGRLDRWQCNRKRPDRTGGGEIETI